jgi:hypothetical protein
MRDVTPGRSPLTRIRGATSRMGEILHRRADARAAARGWEITTTRAGLGRTYRDGRWRYAGPCPRCAGEGVDRLGNECPRYAGAGRLVHRPGRWAS